MWKSTQFLFGELAVTGGTECSSVVEQWHCKLCAAGSIPAFPIPMNCNHWNIFLLLRSVPVFLVGRFMPFKSAHWTFLIKEMVFMDTKGCKCCCTCKWYAVCEGACCNGDSEHCADFRFFNDGCECWENLDYESINKIMSDLKFYKNAYKQLRTRCIETTTDYFDRGQYYGLIIRPTREKKCK